MVDIRQLEKTFYKIEKYEVDIYYLRKRILNLSHVIETIHSLKQEKIKRGDLLLLLRKRELGYKLNQRDIIQYNTTPIILFLSLFVKKLLSKLVYYRQLSLDLGEEFF